MVLVIDDDSITLSYLAQILADNKYAVLSAKSAERALELIAQGVKPGLILLDMRMEGMDGNGFMDEMLKRGERAKIILLTGAPEHLREDLHGQIVGVLQKPFTREQAAEAINTAMGRPVNA